ncbi:cation:proton antiporter [Enterococcus sp. LJL120]
MEFIGVLCLILLATTIASHFSQKIGIPAVVGQLLIGVILGEGVLNWLHPDTLIHEFSEIGVILLMFIAGMESNLSQLKKYLRPALLVASFGILLPLFLGFGTGQALAISTTEAIFFGIILTATSVSISVEVLKELKALDTKEGSTILGAAVIDDILTVLLVSFSFTFLAPDNSRNTPSILLIVLEDLLYFLLIYCLVKWLAPYLMNLSRNVYAPAAVIIVSLVICLSMAYLADLVGLSSVIGAFFAGVAISQTKDKTEVHRNVEALGYAVFIPVFFVSIGLSVSFGQLKSQIVLVVAFVLVAIAAKMIGGFIGSKLSGFSNNSSWMIGAGMVSRGEMALIILQLGTDAGVVASDYYSSLVLIILVTTLVSPLILKYFTNRTYAKSASNQ